MLNSAPFGMKSAEPRSGRAYMNFKQLPTHWRTDLHTQCSSQSSGAYREAIATMRAVLDRLDFTSSIAGIEVGQRGFGFSLLLGLRASF